MESDNDRSWSRGRETHPGASLRRQAEEQLQANGAATPRPRTRQEMQRLVQEFEVHQVELEMQNEELRRTQEELELSRNTYVELYDFAPVGYVTLDPGGLIHEVNLAGARLLGMERGVLLNRPLVTFIAEESERMIFSNHRAEVVHGLGKRTCDLTLTRKDGSLFRAQLQSVSKEKIDGESGYISTTISDITELKRVEQVEWTQESRQ